MRGRNSRLRLALGVTILGAVAMIVFWNHGGAMGRAVASPPPQVQQVAADVQPRPAPTGPSEYSQRVVAYINGGKGKITREDLGEYLIARVGKERLENLVNLRIIQSYCEQKKIEITQAEIDAEFAEMLKGMPNVTAKEFEQKVLRPRNKSLYEFKEDVIKPRIMLSRLCHDQIKVTEDDIKDAFNAYYGEHVECRMILWPPDQKNVAMNMYNKIRDSEEEFDRAARAQMSQALAQSGGRIAPIGHKTTGNPALERAAFSLQPNELSELIGTPEGPVVLKCIKRSPPDTSKRIEAERDKLAKEVFEKKLNMEIPNQFKKLLADAHPEILLKDSISEEQLLRDVRQMLKPENGEQHSK
jgi:hypothetical protein